MTLFPRLSLGFRKPIRRRLDQLVQKFAAILKESKAQTQLDGLQILDPLLAPLLTDQG